MGERFKKRYIVQLSQFKMLKLPNDVTININNTLVKIQLLLIHPYSSHVLSMVYRCDTMLSEISLPSM